ncbi:hypothetical protein KAI52_02915 [Candidatus Parcubacteria bacterium]|nr:hypothetical protein [Candidatus Parcubacteria bacterium]
MYKHKLIRKLLGKLNIITVFVITAMLASGTTIYVLASDVSQFSQVISAGTWSADFVDASGVTVGSPGVTMTGITFSFDTQDANGQIGTDTQRIRANNPTATAGWSVTIGTTNTLLWQNGGSTENFDFNDTDGYTDGAGDTDSVGGQMTINPSTGTRGGWPDNTACPVTEITLGSSSSFVEGSTDNITIISASGSAPTGCRWHFIGAADNITQKIPASQVADTYTLDLTVTIGS